MKGMVKQNSASMPERYFAIRAGFFAIDAPLTSALLAPLRFEEDLIRSSCRLCRALSRRAEVRGANRIAIQAI